MTQDKKQKSIRNKGNNIKYKIMASIIMSGLMIILLTSFVDIANIKEGNNNEIQRIEEKSFQDYNQMIQDDVNIAIHMMQRYYEQYEQGLLTEEEAKNRAIDMVKSLRYRKDNTGYFWIDDTQGNLIGHPMIPEKEGNNRMNITDPNGVKLIEKIIDVATHEAEGGFVDFMWEKPKDVGHGQLSSKRTYSKLFKPWGYIISTGNYIDDIEASVETQKTILANEVEKNIRMKIILSFVFIIGLIFISLFLSNRISKPIIEITKNIGKDENGQIKIMNLEINTKDEIGYLANAINEMTHQVKSFLNETKEDTEILNENINHENHLLVKVQGAIHNNSEEISIVNEEIHFIAKTIEKIDETLYEVQTALTDIGEKTEETTEKTIEVNERADRLKISTIQSKENTKAIYQDVKSNIEKALKEIEIVTEINELTAKINIIAGQTKLLSLNASIQAANSGSAGGAFLVVADEVQKLAESTKETAKNIQIITKKVVDTVNNLSQSTLKIIDFVDQDVLPQYNEMATAADVYSRDAKNINDVMLDLNATFEEITASSNEILEKTHRVTENLIDTTQSMNRIDLENKNIMVGISEIKEHSGDNLNKTRNLKQFIEKFKM